MRARDNLQVEVTYAPTSPLPADCTVVLVIEGVPPPSVRSANQAGLLEQLLEKGHGAWLRMQSWFKQLDEDGSGSLSPDELKTALADLGLKAHKRAIRELMETLDKDGDGRIGLAEYMSEKHTMLSPRCDVLSPRAAAAANPSRKLPPIDHTPR